MVIPGVEWKGLLGCLHGHMLLMVCITACVLYGSLAAIWQVTHVLRCGSRDKAYVPGAKPKAELEVLDKELLELVAELQPTPEERQRQQVRCTGLLTCTECTVEVGVMLACTPGWMKDKACCNDS